MAGDWEALYFDEGSDDSVLQHVEVRYGGNASNPGYGGWFRPSIQIAESDLEMTDVGVLSCDSVGVRILSGSPMLARVSVDTARQRGFELDLAATPTMSEPSS